MRPVNAEKMSSNGHNITLALTGARSKDLGDVSPLLTVEEVAELLRLPVSWVYERTRRRSIDRIPGFRLGKYWRFRESEVMTWIERQRVGDSSSA